MECTFQVGDKVVCVDAHAGDAPDLKPSRLNEGWIYTIRWCGIDDRNLHTPGGPYDDCLVCVRLVEINPRDPNNTPTHRDLPYAAARFRHTKSLLAHGKQSADQGAGVMRHSHQPASMATTAASAAKNAR